MQETHPKRIILIGRSAVGKTTLVQAINHEVIHYHKTQTVTVINKTMIDTPGEYLERRGFRGCLMVTACDADIIVCVQSATEDGTMFPPAYSSQFAKPCVGIVSKCDAGTPQQIDYAEKVLKMAGASRIFHTSAVENQGVREFVEYIWGGMDIENSESK